MIIRYNQLDRTEAPAFTLCNPGSVYRDGRLTKVVGMIPDSEAEEFVFNFNATSELNLRINKVFRESEEENRHVAAIYKAVQNRRLLYAEDVGYFMITNVEEQTEGNLRYKDVTAKSIDIELADKAIPYIENGTYRFSSGGENHGLIEKVVSALPLWTIVYIDDAVAQKYRTFEDVDVTLNCLGFMLENMQDAYECIFVFDIIHRTISVYDQANYVRRTSIHITNEDLIKSLNVTENADDIYTAINVLGGENVTISAINPLGTNVLYDFSHYLDWMSDGLGEKVQAWQNAVETEREPYCNLNLQYYQKLSEVSQLELDIAAIDSQIDMYTRCRENIVATSSTDLVADYNAEIIESGGEPITIETEISDTLNTIDGLIRDYDEQSALKSSQLLAAKNALSNINDEVLATHNRLAILKYFTEEEYTELCHYIFEGTYTDEYVTFTDIMTHEEQFEQMKTLYDRAAVQLDRVSRPSQEFDVDVESFIFLKDFEEWAEQLETGCLINVELEVNDIAELFLSNITVNYEEHSLKMTFGNRFNKYDPKSLYDEVLGQISRSSNTLGYIKEILHPIRNGEFNAMQEALQASRDLTMRQALASTNEEVIIDGSGYLGRKKKNNGTYDPRQVKLVSNCMVFTSNGWESADLAIGEIILGDGTSIYGINAKAIFGELLMGGELRILDKDGNDILTVVDNKIEASVNDGAVKIKTTNNSYTFDDDGLRIAHKESDIENLVDHLGMHVYRNSGEIKDEVLTADNTGVSALNLTARQYLIVGNNSRFENYDNGTDANRTACFFVSPTE